MIRCFSNVPVNYLSPDNFMRTTGVNLFDAVKLKKIYKIQSIQNTCEVSFLCLYIYCKVYGSRQGKLNLNI